MTKLYKTLQPQTKLGLHAEGQHGRKNKSREHYEFQSCAFFL
jgi:hypothetical protein